MPSHTTFRLLLIALAAFAVCAFVYIFDPMHWRWFPKCPFYMFTGLECPACGSSRALYHILHGEFVKGISFNPFILAAWPLLGVVAYLLWRNDTRRLTWVVRLFVALILLWWVVRNIIGA